MSYQLGMELITAALVHIVLMCAIPWATLRPLGLTRNIP
jgi:hypothetical protein